MTGVGALREEVRQISALLEAAHRFAVDGRGLELSGVMARVESCCAAIRALPRPEAAEVRPALLGLIDDLGRLERAIRKGQAEVAEQLGRAGVRRRAVAAYGGARGKR